VTRGVTIVGLDGSLTAFGWSIVVLSPSAGLTVIEAGCVRTKPDPRSRHLYAADSDGARVDAIATVVLDVIARAPAALQGAGGRLVAIEAPAGSQHASAAKALGLAYGISRTACVAHGLVPITVQAHEVRAAIGGGKTASKADVAAGVERMTGWVSTARTKPSREGESDAVAVALTASRHPLAAARWGAPRALGAVG